MKKRLLVATVLLAGLLGAARYVPAAAEPVTVEVKVKRVILDPSSNSPVVLLESVKEHKFIPIWIGKSEATSIALELEHVQIPRPNTHDLIRNIVQGLGAKLHRITITELKNNTYFAVISLALKDQEFEIDSRPSDAIAIALRMRAPIYADPEVLRKAGRTPLSLARPKGVRNILGFDIQDLTEELASFFDVQAVRGVLVAHVEPNGAASRAGFQRGDVITEINGKAIRNVADLESLVERTERPASLEMTIRRKGKPTTVVLRLSS